MVELKGVSSHQKHMWWINMVNQYYLACAGACENESDLVETVFYRDDYLLQSILVRQIGL
ncbi:MAG: hypothetical protein COB20_12025 [SAR86 cluster bacterium]|uniref:Uncharacterized protein n=1 Tax=SAR86 cluster bacterium TaxID=2030880 RepID=A0A2A4X058_9GAMM|nr:MAG: hypothetical protein COB20_12025 [SAR86 cluster bacterium]